MTNRRERWLYLVAFPAGHGAVDWGSGAFFLLAPAIALSMGLSPAQVGLLFTMKALGAGLANIPAGLLGDALRYRGPFLLGTLWWVVVAYLATSVVPGYWLLGIFLAIASAGAAAWHPVAMGTMVQRMPGNRAFALAVHGVGGTVPSIVAPLSAGFLLAFLGWREVLQLSTIPAVIMGILFLRLSRMVGPSVQRPPSRLEISRLAKVLLQPTALGIFLVLVLYNMSTIALMSMLPLYLQEVRGFSSSLTGIAFSLLMVAGTVVALVVSRISDRRGRKPMALAGLFGGGGCIWLITVAPGTLGVFIALIATGLLLLTVRSVLMASALDVIGGRESTVLGVLFAIGEGVGATGAALAGLVGESSLAMALVLASVLALASGLVASVHPFAPAAVPSEMARR